MDPCWKDREFVLGAVRHSGTTLRHAAGWLQNDKEVVLAAVVQNGEALVHASQWMRDDYDVVLAALKNMGRVPPAFYSVSDRLRDNETVARAAFECYGPGPFQHNGDALQDVSTRLRDDYHVVLAAIQNDGHLRYASPRLQLDPDLVAWDRWRHSRYDTPYYDNLILE